MTNVDEKIYDMFINISANPSSMQSLSYLKTEIKNLMEEYSKEKLEAFIDDHFPEDSLNKKQETKFEVKEGEFIHTTKIQDGFGFLEADTNTIAHLVASGKEGYALPRHVVNSIEFVDRFVGDAADLKLQAGAYMFGSFAKKFKIGQTVYALEDNEIIKYKIIDIDVDPDRLYSIFVKDDDDNLNFFTEEELFETVEELLNNLRNKAKDL